MSEPFHDSPFEPDEVEHIARRLWVLGIVLDRPWLKADIGPVNAFILDGHSMLLNKARETIPRSNAQWELSDFFRYAMPGAAFDCQFLGSYESFEFLYRRILGEASRPWLPSLYLAAATLPARDETERTAAILKFKTDVFFD